MPSKKYFLIIIALYFSMLITSQGAYAANNVLRVDVPEYIHPGDEFVAQVYLENPNNLGALDFSLRFDAAKLEILQLNGACLEKGEALSNAFLIYPGGQLRQENGYYVVNMPISWVGGITYNGKKLIGKIYFRAVAEGDASFDFTKKKMYTPQNGLISPIAYGDLLKVDGTGPSLIVEFPQNGLRTNQRMVTCYGTTEVGAKLRINNQNIPIDSLGKWEYTVSLIKGGNQIKLWAQDPAGNITEKSVHIMLDTAVTGFMLNSSFWGKSTLRSALIISGQVEPGGRVQVNGEDASFQENSQTGWYAWVSLKEGLNFITCLARDQAGNSVFKQIQIIRESKRRSYLSFLKKE